MRVRAGKAPLRASPCDSLRPRCRSVVKEIHHVVERSPDEAGGGGVQMTVTDNLTVIQVAVLGGIVVGCSSCRWALPLREEEEEVVADPPPWSGEKSPRPVHHRSDRRMPDPTLCADCPEALPDVLRRAEGDNLILPRNLRSDR